MIGDRELAKMKYAALIVQMEVLIAEKTSLSRFSFNSEALFRVRVIERQLEILQEYEDQLVENIYGV